MAVVSFLAPDTDSFVASVQRHIAEFEHETGHTAELSILGSDLYFSNKIHSFLEGTGAADAYMSGPVLLWEHLAAGFAWDFIQWASSRSFLLRSAVEGNMNPTRRSVWDDESFVRLTGAWDGFAAVSRRLIEDFASVLVTPSSDYLAIATGLTRALLDAYSGRATVRDALTRASRDIERIANGQKR